MFSLGTRKIFCLSGGGIMHLLDSCAKQDGLDMIYNLNEQATGICADTYAQYTNRLGVALITTGPGATNAVTGCAGAWLDSSPVLFISGQTKRADLGQLRGLRQFGAQEISIIPMVKPITKYAEIVMEPLDIKYHLEKAVFLASHGRRGPVWLDIPLDVQGAQIDETQLREFIAEEEFPEYFSNLEIHDKQIQAVIAALNNSKRPVILFGHGLIAAGGEGLLRKLSDEYRIPVLSTWRGKGAFGDDDELYFGMPGIPAKRYSNYVLQNADLLIVIGTRLNFALTAYAEERFGIHAKKIMVDIDQKEIDKLKMKFELTLNTDAKVFLQSVFDNKRNIIFKDRSPWLKYCEKMKAKYPINKEIQPLPDVNKVDGYLFGDKLSNLFREDDIIIGSPSGRTCAITHMAFNIKRKQKFLTSMGIGSMGWMIPSGIAASVASGRKRTIIFEGDGSLQHNIQELALINTYHLPIKLFVLSNGGYNQIYGMQMNNFNSRFAGCHPESGVRFPELKKVAVTYGLTYYVIHDDSEIDEVLQDVMKDDHPVLCEVMGSINFDEIPKSKTIVNSDGTFSSSLLENLYPFVSEEEQIENMPDWEE